VSAETSVGLGAGLTPHLWVDGSPGTFKMAPKPGWHSPQIGLNALLLDTPALELDAALHITFVAEDGRPVEQIEPGASAVVHLAHRLRVDGSLFLDVNPGPTTTLGLRIPLSGAFQITDHVYAAMNTGLTIGDFGDLAGTTAIPAGMTFGWGDRLGGRTGPSVAVSPTFSFPELIKPGANTLFRPGYVTVGLTLVIAGKK
jgi:hypothetical protein